MAKARTKLERSALKRKCLHFWWLLTKTSSTRLPTPNWKRWLDIYITMTPYRNQGYMLSYILIKWIKSYKVSFQKTSCYFKRTCESETSSKCYVEIRTLLTKDVKLGRILKSKIWWADSELQDQRDWKNLCCWGIGNISPVCDGKQSKKLSSQWKSENMTEKFSAGGE